MVLVAPAADVSVDAAAPVAADADVVLVSVPVDSDSKPPSTTSLFLCKYAF